MSDIFSKQAKEIFAREYVSNNTVKIRAIKTTYDEINRDYESTYMMYKNANSLLEDEEVTTLVDMYQEEKKMEDMKDYKTELMKTQKALWDTFNEASKIENKHTKKGDAIDGVFRFQDSNAVVATLQVLSKQADKIREQIEKLEKKEQEKSSDIIRIEWEG